MGLSRRHEGTKAQSIFVGSQIKLSGLSAKSFLVRVFVGVMALCLGELCERIKRLLESLNGFSRRHEVFVQ